MGFNEIWEVLLNYQRAASHVSAACWHETNSICWVFRRSAAGTSFFLLFCMELRKRNRVKMWSEDNLNRNLILMEPPPNLSIELKKWWMRLIPCTSYQLSVWVFHPSPTLRIFTSFSWQQLKQKEISTRQRVNMSLI